MRHNRVTRFAAKATGAREGARFAFRGWSELQWRLIKPTADTRESLSDGALQLP